MPGTLYKVLVEDEDGTRRRVEQSYSQAFAARRYNETVAQIVTCCPSSIPIWVEETKGTIPPQPPC